MNLTWIRQKKSNLGFVKWDKYDPNDSSYLMGSLWERQTDYNNWLKI
jgi:hypothetical protein